MNKELYQQFITNPEIKNSWPAAFLRDEVITDLLGADLHSILYWAGKSMARKYATTTNGELVIFFKQTGLGDLAITNEGDSFIEYQITGAVVENRLAVNPDADFMLETGLLAQSIEQQKHLTAEAEINKKQLKKGNVLITVHIDPKNPVDDFEPIQPFEIIANQIPSPSSSDDDEDNDDSDSKDNKSED
ncbi:DUF2507 domain-containing protein [Nicoliella lavandulae]|uniref:DUF2507 domain-containing protein n=1 Tax=Nicoliella lavandulae TaxID=3082954 RepID=A0ABU8SLR8_9LACO